MVQIVAPSPITPSYTAAVKERIRDVDLQACNFPRQAINQMLGTDPLNSLNYTFNNLVDVLSNRKSYVFAINLANRLQQDLVGMGLTEKEAESSVNSLVTIIEREASEKQVEAERVSPRPRFPRRKKHLQEPESVIA